MKKKLYFYFWVCPDFENNIAVKVNEFCLKRYLQVFDELNFVIAVDDILNRKDIKRGIDWIKSVVDDKPFNTRLELNSQLRESVMVLRDLMPMIIEKSNDMVFICHMKGVTNIHDIRMSKESVSRWIMSMWWYNLEYINDVEKQLFQNKTKTMFGALMSHFNTRRDSSIQNHNTIYIGGFYWIKPNNFIDNALYEEIIPKQQVGRYLSENFSMCLKRDALSSNEDVCLIGEAYDTYSDDTKKWLNLLDNYSDKNKILEFQNNLIKGLNINN